MINVDQTRLADREAAALHVGSDRRDECLLFTGVFAALLPPPMYLRGGDSGLGHQEPKLVNIWP